MMKFTKRNPSRTIASVPGGPILSKGPLPTFFLDHIKIFQGGQLAYPAIVSPSLSTPTPTSTYFPAVYDTGSNIFLSKHRGVMDNCKPTTSVTTGIGGKLPSILSGTITNTSFPVDYTPSLDVSLVPLPVLANSGYVFVGNREKLVVVEDSPSVDKIVHT